MARARGLAIFQWDLLEHHSKALRPPGRASHPPSPWHFHLVPSHSTLSFGLQARREREKGLRGRDERPLVSSHLLSSRFVSSRPVFSRLDARRGYSSANYFILTPGPSDCACLSLDCLRPRPAAPSGHQSFRITSFRYARQTPNTGIPRIYSAIAFSG